MSSWIDELDSVDDRPVVSLLIEAWGKEVTFRRMTPVENDELSVIGDKEKKPTNHAVRKASLIRGLCDQDGNRLKPEIIDKVMTKSCASTDEMLMKIAELNGLTKEAREKLLGKQEANSSEEQNSSG